MVVREGRKGVGRLVKERGSGRGIAIGNVIETETGIETGKGIESGTEIERMKGRLQGMFLSNSGLSLLLNVG